VIKVKFLFSFILAAFLMAAGTQALGAEEPALTIKYQGFDANGHALSASSLILFHQRGEQVGLYREAGCGEQRIVLSVDTGKLSARFSGPDEGKIFTAVFKIAEGRVLVQSEESPLKDWKPGLREGNSSLFFIIPRLLDLRAGASKARFSIQRIADNQNTSFIFECRGRMRIRVGAETLDAYEVRMELGDPLLHFFWPYVYSYYFRVSDLVMVRFEGPDAKRRICRVDLQSVEKSFLERSN